MKKKLIPLVAFAAIVVALGGCGRDEEVADDGPVTPPMVQHGQPATETPPATATPAPADAAETAEAKSTMNEVDREFATQAFGSSIAEVQAGRLASEKTLNEDIRQYAKEMVKDHTSSNEELTKIAQIKKLELPTAPLASFKDALQQMTTVTGPQHDRFYLQQFGADAHRQVVKLYEREVREGQDGDLRDYAERWIPVLRHHLERAEKIAGGIDTSP